VQALNGVAFFAAIDWTPVIVAALTLVGVCVNVLAGVYIAVHVRTPSGTRIGKQVEDANVTAITNRHLLVRIAREMGMKADDPQLRSIIEGDDPR
jgi:hypothetical protein